MKSHKNAVSGIALVIVLGFLVIISGLAVAFFSSVTTELKASRNFAAGITTRQLSDSAVQIVIGQIAAATTRGIDGTGVGNEAWASQPGMIRVFGKNSGSGSIAASTADAFFKLYSSDKMVLTAGNGLSGFDPMGPDDLDKSWNQAPALWTDLNAPVMVRDPNAPSGSSVPRFPIIDPRAYNRTINPNSANDLQKWDNNNVEGFYYDTASGVAGMQGPGGDPNDQRLPMPVKWLYVLQDGTLTVPTGGTTTAKFGTNAPTQTNPIVGRIAFWTDDETCKLNINTAAGYSYKMDGSGDIMNASAYQNNPSMLAGSYWDTPRFYTQFDYGQPDANGLPKGGITSGGLALCQLLQNEFQRYPGHPATTSLAPVLKNLLNSAQIYGVVPRYSDKNRDNQGSASTMGGTNRIIVDKTQADIDAKQLQPKQDRLYASVDELLYGAHSSSNPNGSGYLRVLNNNYVGTTAITPGLVDGLRFFLTTQSRAPELNLFGQPRVTCWPVRSEGSNGPSGLNAFDNLILFCSTIGQLQTANPPSRPDTTIDYPAQNQGVYRYIFTRKELANTDTQAASHPDGFGGTITQREFVGSYKPDCELGRNMHLLKDYLPGLLSRAIPGNGFAFANSNKFPNPTVDTQAILAEIFDYIRLANSQDTTTATLSGTAIKFAPRGMLAPSLPTYYNTQAKGFGRMSTLCEATVDFYYAGPEMVTDSSYNPGSPLKPNNGSWSRWDNAANFGARYAKSTPKDSNGKCKITGGYMRAFFLFSTFDPMQGYAPKSDPAEVDPKLSIEVSFQGDWKVTVDHGHGTDQALGFVSPLNPTAALSTTVYRAPGSYWGGRNVGGYEGFMHTLMGRVDKGSNGAYWAPYKIKWKPGTTNDAPLQDTDFGETMGGPKNQFSDANVIPAADQEYYPFQSNISNAIWIPGPGTPSNQTFVLKPTPMTVRLFYGGSSQGLNRKSLQTINLNFPQPTAALPIPQGPPPDDIWFPDPSNQTRVPTTDVTTWEAMPAGSTATLMKNFYFFGHGSFFDDNGMTRGGTKPSPYTYQTSLQASWSFATRLAWCTLPLNGRGDGGQSYEPFRDANNNPVSPGYFQDRWRCIVQPGDTIRSLLYWDGNSAQGGPISGMQRTTSGDLRVAALTSNIPPASFAPHVDYNGGQSRACVLRRADGAFCFPAGTNQPAAVQNNPEASLGNHIYMGSAKMPPSRGFANLPRSGGANQKGVNGVNRPDDGGQWPGDFDTGIGDFPDGPFCNKQDEGNVVYAIRDYNNRLIYPIPYFTATWAYQAPGNTFTSPSRQMPSAAMMGSLPSYAPEGRGWTTLCFSPNPAGEKHPGIIQDPKDHYLLDLFQMPVVEPYPISEPFSTAGKVNLNYRIVPFDYIRRSTALRGALFPLRVTVVNSQYASGGNTANYLVYKTGQPGQTDANGNPLPISTNFRDRLDRDKTIQAIDGFYDQGLGHPDIGFFKSASQICERWLYSINFTAPYPGVQAEDKTMQSWWEQNGDLTGDNEREKPYVDLYPRITTKSNTYTVHMRVQTCRQAARPGGTGYDTWVEGKDNVLGEYRGSVTIERYIDPADPRFNPTYQNPLIPGQKPINPDKQSVEPLYRFRTVISKKFTP